MGVEGLVENTIKEVCFNEKSEYKNLSVSKLESLINDSGLAFKKTEDGSLSRRRVCVYEKNGKNYIRIPWNNPLTDSSRYDDVKRIDDEWIRYKDDVVYIGDDLKLNAYLGDKQQVEKFYKVEDLGSYIDPERFTFKWDNVDKFLDKLNNMLTNKEVIYDFKGMWSGWAYPNPDSYAVVVKEFFIEKCSKSVSRIGVDGEKLDEEYTLKFKGEILSYSWAYKPDKVTMELIKFKGKPKLSIKFNTWYSAYVIYAGNKQSPSFMIMDDSPFAKMLSVASRSKVYASKNPNCICNLRGSYAEEELM